MFREWVPPHFVTLTMRLDLELFEIFDPARQLGSLFHILVHRHCKAAKMSCSCRTAALGIFLRNIAHGQLPVAASGRFARYQIPLGHLARLPRNASALTSPAYRSLHTTNVRHDGSAPQAIISEQAEHGRDEPVADAEATSEDADSISGADIAAWSAPKKPRARGRPRKETKEDATAKKKGRWREKKESHNGSSSTAEAAKPADHTTKKRPSLIERLTEERALGRDVESWKIQKAALKEKFPEGWKPRKKLSPDALAGIRALHAEFPNEYTTEVLAQKFEVSAEAIRRILKSRWTPNPDEEIKRQERWFNRGKSVYARWAEMGIKPPRKWREAGVTRDPFWNERKKVRSQKDQEARARAHSLLSQNLM
ncbi:hypothetical protein QBC47DRAFT_384409 [Echria macrotheca]|uniref:Required for respiratory growth protein 9, mitochondrial n=1 Tax=Echria macrotheca TaxID=438768 RepID=A0AAJ0F5J7_9PEZI|nr:hypothetical protein QBC47DRAFT_384409 [Echria macrotheca]